jgi:hypothetical protein
VALTGPSQARVARHSSFWTGNGRGTHWSWTGEGGKALIILDMENDVALIDPGQERAASYPLVRN